MTQYAVGDGECGVIHQQRDIQDLAEKTLTAFADPAPRQHGPQRVLAEYDWRVVAPQLDRIVRELLAPSQTIKELEL